MILTFPRPRRWRVSWTEPDGTLCSETFRSRKKAERAAYVHGERIYEERFSLAAWWDSA